MQERKLRIAQKISLLEIQIELRQQQREWEDMERRREFIPSDWHEMEKIAPCTTPKQKLSLALDRDVVKFYRGLGRGYQARMNAILRTYMHARIARLIEGHGDHDVNGEPI